MKKFLVFIFSFIFLVGGGVLASSVLDNAYAAETTTKNISNADEFVRAMADPTVYNDSDVVLKLTADVDFSETTLSAGETGRKFMGTFDGNGYTISNLSFSSNSQYFGLFPQADGATIKDVKVSGTVQYEFKPSNILDLYVGVLVGYGENVTFSNCELDNVTTVEGGGNIVNKIELPVYSNVYFGTLAGRIRNDITSKTQNSITNCVSYYDVNVNLVKDTDLFLGGLVGQVQQGYFLGCLSYGNVNLTSSISGLSASNKALNSSYLGGVVGSISGSMSNMRNTIYGGDIQTPSSSSGLNCKRGAFVGSMATGVNKENVNFVYFTSKILSPSGDGSIERSDKVAQKDNINRDFLIDSNNENFDPASEHWDFDLVWTLVNSRFHLQNFRLFSYGFNNILDTGRIIERATVKSETGTEGTTLSAKYDETVIITIYLKEDYQGYYLLNDVLLRGSSISGRYTAQEFLNAENEIAGYQIRLKANATTEGTAYSFNIVQREYKCVITVSDEAQATNHGGVLIDNGSSPSFNDVNITFYGNSRARKVVAEGQDIFIFDHWELYFRDSSGNFNVRSNFESGDSELSITFGNAPFDQEFKLVAYFTDKNAISVDFGTIRGNIIKSVVLGGKTYANEPLFVSPNNSQTLEVVVAKNYELDVDAFLRDIKTLYGDNPTTAVFTGEPKLDEETGERTYRFNINMRYITNIDEGGLKLSFITREEGGGGNNSLLWLWIVLPIVVVAAAAIVVIVIIKKRRGGGSDDFGGGTKVKEKKVSYKDFY